jgi:hypothetical protein
MLGPMLSGELEPPLLWIAMATQPSSATPRPGTADAAGSARSARRPSSSRTTRRFCADRRALARGPFLAGASRAMGVHELRCHGGVVNHGVDLRRA